MEHLYSPSVSPSNPNFNPGASGQPLPVNSGNGNAVSGITAIPPEKNIPPGQFSVPNRPLQARYLPFTPSGRFNFYTHRAADLQSTSLNREPHHFAGAQMSKGFLAEISPDPDQIFSIHDQLELENGSTPTFWEYLQNNAENNPEKNELDYLQDYFREYPDKLVNLKHASVLAPWSGYYSQRNSPWLSSVVTQLFLLLKKDEEAFIAVIPHKSASGRNAQPMASQCSADILPTPESAAAAHSNQYSQDLLSDREFGQILSRVIAPPLTRKHLIAQLMGKLGPVDQYSTHQLVETFMGSVPDPDEKLFKSWMLFKGNCSKNTDLITLKSSLYLLCQEQINDSTCRSEHGIGTETAQANNIRLNNTINHRIQGIDDVLQCLASFRSEPIEKTCTDYHSGKKIKVTAVSSKHLKKYIGTLQPRCFKATRTPRPVTEPYNSLKHDRAFADDSARGIFYISTGNEQLEKGVEEVIRESPITAKELCNIGGNADISSQPNLDRYLQFTTNSVYYRPAYLGLKPPGFTASYSRSETLSALMSMINQLSGRTIIHPVLTISTVPVSTTRRTVIPDHELQESQAEGLCWLPVKRSFRFLSDRGVKAMATDTDPPGLHLSSARS